jgi:oligoendopeptidase F
MLLVDKLLALDLDPDVQRALLFQQMDAAYLTIMRQAHFALFEREAHERIHQGATIAEITSLYAENLSRQFGDSVEVSPAFRYEWLAISHIYQVPFYVYAYAFGQLLVFSLYQRYREEGQAFKPAYQAILAAGGSDSPARILRRAGVAIESPAFWQGGFDVIGRLLERLEGLAIPAN